MPLNAELIANCLQPIAPDAPSGAEVRYDPRVDAIKEARREELLPGADRKLADWGVVIGGISQLLTRETKDLQLGAWLVEGLLRRDGFGGLATGLTILRGLVDDFWDTVHPLPEDGDIELRIGPVEWVGTRLGLAIRLTPFLPGGVSQSAFEESRRIPTETDAETDEDKRTSRTEALEAGKLPPETVDQALEAATKTTLRAVLADLDAASGAALALDKACSARFGSDAPSFTDLRATIEGVHRFVAGQVTRKLELDPDPVADMVEGVEERAPVDPDAPMPVEPVNAQDAAARLGLVARWLRKADPANPAPYALLRGFRWGELRARAPEVEPRLLEAPPTAVRSRLKALLLDGKWPELLEQAEGVMATPAGRGWLDLQRYVITACTQQGGAYDAVAAVVRTDLRALLAALPQLPRTTLMDDTPTANDDTRDWLADEGLLPDEAPAESWDDASGDAMPTDGSEYLETAVADDHVAAEPGGFSRRRPRPRAPGQPADPFDLACAELAAGRPNRAIERLMGELSRERSARGRFIRQTQIAYLMVEAGLYGVAQPILQKLIETIDELALDKWESGPLVAQPLALMVKVLDNTGGDSGMSYELYLRICRLDPMQALALPAR